MTLAGEALAGFVPSLPGGSVRLLLPPPSPADLLPTWTGNDYRYDDGKRATIRTLTPLRFDADALELDVEVVRHGAGPLSEWAGAAGPGAVVAVSGPGRGYEIDQDAGSFLLAGDESALPALSQLVSAVPEGREVLVIVEVADAAARVDLPAPPGVAVSWHEQAPDAMPGEALVTAVMSASLGPDTRIWVAGEAGTMQRIRRHLFEERGVDRGRAVVRGYWKHGRAGGEVE